MSENEAKHCFLRSLSYWSHKTLESNRALENIKAAAIIVESVGQVAFSSDPDDNIMLATAIAGRADLIVSGDKPGMLSLGEVEGIRIVTPREALDRLEAGR
jgi:uncharacterized protein